VGLFSRFRRQPVEPPPETPAGSFADPEGQPVVGQQAPGGPMWGMHPSLGNELTSVSQGMAMMRQMGPMLTNGTQIRDEMFEVMKRHGVDPMKGIAPGQYNPTDLAGMEQEIMQVYSKHGINIGALEQQAISNAQGTVPMAGWQIPTAAPSNELQAEIFEIMKRHGVDPEKGMTAGFDASSLAAMQQEIMAAYSKHGFNFQPPSSAG
jgi:hypothetical protein